MTTRALRRLVFNARLAPMKLLDRLEHALRTTVMLDGLMTTQILQHHAFNVALASLPWLQASERVQISIAWLGGPTWTTMLRRLASNALLARTRPLVRAARVLLTTVRQARPTMTRIRPHRVCSVGLVFMFRAARLELAPHSTAVLGGLTRTRAQPLPAFNVMLARTFRRPASVHA